MKAIRVLTFSTVVALVLMAVVAGAAYATTSEWLIEGETMSKLSLTEEKTQLTGGPITLAIPGKSLTIECKVVEGSGKILKGGTEQVSAKLFKCEVAKPSSCKVSEPVLFESKSNLIETKSNFYDKLEAVKEGGAIATITLTGEKCEKIEVKGTVAAEVSFEEKAEQSQKFSETISKTVNEALAAEKKSELSLLWGSQAVHLSGTLTRKLSGGNAGKVWYKAPDTTLCMENQDPCPEGKSFNSGTVLTAVKEVSMRFKYGAAEPVCTASKLSGSTSEVSGDPMGISLTTVEFTNCTTANDPNCTVKALGLPYAASFRAIANGNGALNFPAATKFELICEGVTCIYKGGQSLLAKGGTPMTLPNFGPILMLVELLQPAACNMTLDWEGVTAGGGPKYKFTAPATSFITGI